MKSAEAFLAELAKNKSLDKGVEQTPDSGFEASVDNKPESLRSPAKPTSSQSSKPDLLSGFGDIEVLKKQIENRAVALLAVREHGSKELTQKLLKKFPESPELLAEYQEVSGFVKGLVQEVIQLCQDNNWQSDERYLEQAVRSYSEKGQGPLKIKQKLQQACYDSSLIAMHLDWDESDWVEIAQQVLAKKYGDCRKPTAAKEQAKRVRFLQSRGFFPSTVWKAFKSF